MNTEPVSANNDFLDLLQTTREYGNEKARYYSIHFAEWIATNNWQASPESVYIGLWFKDGEIKTTHELYELFEHRNDWKTP